VVTKLVLEAFAAMLNFTVGLFPNVTMPTFLTDVTTYIGDGLARAGDFAWFFPINPLKQVMVFLLVCIAIAWTIRIVRLAVGYIPTMGGSQQ
jgi:hypothetical protein